MKLQGPASRVVPRRELLTKLSPGVSLGREFVRAEDVRRIVNAASFLIQEYGQCFNRVVSLTLWCDPEHGGTVAIDALCAALLKASDEANGIPFVCVTERDAYWTKAFVAVCVREPIGDGARISCDPVDAILAAWSQGHRADVSSKVVAPDATVAGRTRFHWNAVALLCAGMLPGLPGDGAGTGRADRLMDGPGFKLLRRPGPISGPPVKISPALGDEAIAKAHRDRLPPIFVADFEAWSHLRTGWEFNEHSDRMAEKKARELARSQIEAAWIGDAERIEDELRRLAESWPEDPTRRQRTFIGWWTRMEAVGA